MRYHVILPSYNEHVLDYAMQRKGKMPIQNCLTCGRTTGNQSSYCDAHQNTMRTREVRFGIPAIDVEAMQHIEPARIIDHALASMNFTLNNRAFITRAEQDKLVRARDDLKMVRNAWVLAIGTIRLQILGGDNA